MDTFALLQTIDYLKPISTIVKIDSGLSHSCFKVTKATQVLFVKIYSTPLNILFLEQIGIEKNIAAQGLSPNILAYSPQGQYCIYEYVTGKTLLESDLQENMKYSYVVDLLVTCHALDFKVKTLDIIESINNLLYRCNLSKKAKANITNSVNARLAQLSINPSELVLCHGDLNFSNVILSNDKPILLDWEYCCLAEREYDIAMSLAINNVSPDLFSSIVAQYNSKFDNSPASLSKVIQYTELCDLINTLWFLQTEDNKTLNNDFNENKNEQVLKPYL